MNLAMVEIVENAIRAVMPDVRDSQVHAIINRIEAGEDTLCVRCDGTRVTHGGIRSCEVCA